MNNMQRRDFLKKLGLLSLVSAILPEAIFGHAGTKETLPMAPELPPAGDTGGFGIIDMHCHPSLKMYLWDLKIWKKHHPVPGPNIFHMQIDTERLNAGYLKGLLATHYLPEIGIEKDSDVLSRLYPFLKLVDPALPRKLENDDYSNFTQINEMINLLEEQLHMATLKNQQHGSKNKEIAIARSYNEFKLAIEEGKIAVAHAIEGAHALGRNIALSKKKKHHHSNYRMYDEATKGNIAQKYIENLLALKARGVCLMALIHFFPSDLIPFPTEGISPDEKKSEGFTYSYGPPKNDLPLTEIGKRVVEKMLEIGMIVDLTHSPRAVRDDVFAINEKRAQPRPLVFTHVGTQELFDTHNRLYDTYQYYDTREDEILRISKCDGVVGVIAENYWLKGTDTHLKVPHSKDFTNGVKYMVETMKKINSFTLNQDYSNISVGSDFDGLADAPKDIYNPSLFGNLIAEMKSQGLTDEQITKVTSDNAMRVLKNGWL